MNDDGKVRLWNWFGLSRSSWLTLPRSFMHEMPDEWQMKMAELLEEWDETFETFDMPSPVVQGQSCGKFSKWPDYVLNYRHPDKVSINGHRI